MTESDKENVVSAKGLRKQYKTVEAVKGIDFDINPGEIFGLIGPDGAGKTTIFHMLGGILNPTAGDLLVLGTAASEARQKIGYLTQTFSLYLDLSVEENIRYAGGLRNVTKEEFVERRDHYLTLMDLNRFKERLAGNLSGGMKQKLALCCALIARPELLLLDEPTTGVDPVSRRDFWDVLATITREGVTVAVATPYLDEAERCTRVALMYQGKIQQLGTPSELKQGIKMHRLELRGEAPSEIQEMVERIATESATAEGESQSGDALARSSVQQSEDIERAPELGMRGVIKDSQVFGDRVDVLVDNLETAKECIQKRALEETRHITMSEQEPTLENVFALLLHSTQQLEGNPHFPFEKTEASQGKAAIQATNLTRHFGSFIAAKDVNLTINYGEIYGLLGANGAGKTTTIKMLCGLLQPSGGEVILAGKAKDLRARELRQKIGYMSQKFTLYEDITVRENLNFYAGVYDVADDLKARRIDWVLKTCGLADSEDMITKQLPGGFRQRLAFGATVLHQPSILFLDEPTSGVDPLARRELWRLIREFAREGTAVLVTTHFLDEAEYCNQLGFMVAGEVVADGPPGEIKSSQPGKLLELKTSDNQRAADMLKQKIEKWRISIFADSLHIVVETDEQERKFLSDINDAGIRIDASRQIPFSLEDAFIGIVQRGKTKQAA